MRHQHKMSLQIYYPGAPTRKLIFDQKITLSISKCSPPYEDLAIKNSQSNLQNIIYGGITK